MGAFKFTPGPILVYARFRTNSTAQFLGTGITSVEPEVQRYFLPSMNDLSGRSVPFQLVYDGEEHTIPFTTNRFDMNVWRAIRATNAGAAGLGAETAASRGTLHLGITDIELILVNTYAGTVVQGFSGTPGVPTVDLNAGRRYFSATLVAGKESTVGTRTLEVAMVFQCKNIFVPSTRGFALYSESQLGTLGPVS